MITVVLDSDDKRVYNANIFTTNGENITLYYIPEEFYDKRYSEISGDVNLISEHTRFVAHYHKGSYKEVYDSQYLVNEK